MGLCFVEVKNILSGIALYRIGEIALVVNIEIPDDNQCVVFGQDSEKLLVIPDIELALLTFTVGIFCGIKRSFRKSHVADHIVQDIFGS